MHMLQLGSLTHIPRNQWGIAVMQSKNDKLIQETADFWSRKAGIRVSHEEARAMHANISGFFAVLLEWDSKDRNGPQQDT